MSSTPKVIYFDLGKVLVDYDFNIAYEWIRERSSLTKDEFGQSIPKIEQLNVLYEAGGIGSVKFFQSMTKTLEFDGSLDSLELYWSDIFKPMTENIEIARCLSKRYPLAIISNTSDAHAKFLEANYSLFSYFEQRVYSHIFGARKPDSKIYKHAQNLMNCEAGQSLFIDDRIENIKGAKDLGWLTIHLDGAMDLQAALFDAGVKFS